MKKIIVVLFILTVFFINNTNSKAIEIPNESIRIRVIANSNTEIDQKVKGEVREKLQEEIAILLKDANGLEEVRKILNENLEDFHINVEKVMNRNNYEEVFHINYGLNYFPEKEFKGITYEEGYYESIVVTIGKGEGDNWWCVLFPPLCLMEHEESSMDDVEYKSFIKEALDKIF